MAAVLHVVCPPSAGTDDGWHLFSILKLHSLGDLRLDDLNLQVGRKTATDFEITVAIGAVKYSYLHSWPISDVEDRPMYASKSNLLHQSASSALLLRECMLAA
jgi:hypothetical protein